LASRQLREWIYRDFSVFLAASKATRGMRLPILFMGRVGFSSDRRLSSMHLDVSKLSDTDLWDLIGKEKGGAARGTHHFFGWVVVVCF